MFGSRERAKEILKILFISVFFLSSFFVYIGCGGRKTEQNHKEDNIKDNKDVYLKLSKVIHEAFLDSVIPVSLVFSVKNLHEGDCIVNEGDKRIFRNCSITDTPFTFYGVLTQSSGRFYLEMNTVYINVNEFIRNATFVFEDINPQEIALISACFDIVPLSANTFCLSNIGLNLSLKGNALTFTYKFSDFSAIQIKDKIQNYVQAKFSPDFSSKVEVLQGGFLKLSVSGKLSLSGCISGDWEVSGETKSPISSCPAEGSVNFGSQSVGFSDGKVIIDGIEKKCEEVSVCGNI